jgi:CubicO group peptidase (beta-lactamase class C family)
LLEAPSTYGVGFELQTELRPLGPPADAFGHTGAGGSIHCAWPSHGVGASYVMNELRDDNDVDPRAQALLKALYPCVARP